ncbi:histidine kinase/DNA gyrase B/HSP90-like ATPase [Kribbella antiqua]|uniref:histidine kinase n=1 Tax=Kribbella antiqua TaxID=2512217 RepID=A0A4V2S5A0_9ACTN|nr:ATP-binding protein [Kribbella antiqua]TCO51370.1 histidine kinase/DNA gyrase B/HSP90-like ATPase [Kribbella antiqua]
MVRLAAGVVATGALVMLAVRADLAAQVDGWRMAVDVAVGVVFIVAGALPIGPSRQRAMVAAVGGAWLLGSVFVQTLSLHQAVLAVALMAFPTGQIRGRFAWLVAALAGVVAVGLVPQPGVALLFALVAVCAAMRPPSARWYPVTAAGAVAVTLGVSWSVARVQESFDPALALLDYEVVLGLVAVTFPVAYWSALRVRRRLADAVLVSRPLTGLDGFALVLGEALGDPSLTVHRWPDQMGRADRQVLTVNEAGHPVAVIAHQSAALEDPLTARAVETAVRLAVTNIRLQDEQLSRLRELEAARARVVAAADRQREEVAEELGQNVAALLRDAQAELAEVQVSGRDTALDIVAAELATAIAEIGDLVAGIPPATLGEGRLHDALQILAARAPAEVAISYSDDSAGDADAETALFYVCSEALANAAKHAEAGRITIDVRRYGDLLEATITDNGRGGADASGSGLTGLSDRLAVLDGRLRVVSPPGAGTTVTATVPCRRRPANRSSATAR